MLNVNVTVTSNSKLKPKVKFLWVSFVRVVGHIGCSCGLFLT